MTAFDPTEYDKRPHRCALPDAESFNAPEGWRCECGRAYRRVTQSQHGETWRQWQRMPEADPRGELGAEDE